MSGMMSKIIGLFFAFILCIMAPYSLAVLSDDITARHLVLSECENFVDEVSDTGRLTDDMLSNFYLDVASHGVMLDVTVEKYTRVVENDTTSSGKLVTTYMRSECDPKNEIGNTVNFSTGDKIVVHVEPVGYSAPQRIVLATIGRVLPDFDYTLPKRVR